jgi:hypothetical protein
MSITTTITPAWLKERYLFGIDLTDDTGTAYPDSLFEVAIDSAIATIEAELDIVISGLKTFTQRIDSNDWDPDNFFLKYLYHKPVRNIVSFKLQLADFDEVTIPNGWIHISNETAGQIQLIPGKENLGGMLYGGKMPFLGLYGLLGRPYTPRWFKVEYQAGYDHSTHLVPNEIIDAIGLLASLLPLDTAGDLIAGAGIASKSVSMDGLSTSINTTSSATNSGYGARSIQYRERLKTQLKRIARKYRPMNMMIL